MRRNQAKLGNVYSLSTYIIKKVIQYLLLLDQLGDTEWEEVHRRMNNRTLGSGGGSQLALPGASESEVPALPPPPLPTNQESQPPWMGMVLSCPQPALGNKINPVSLLLVIFSTSISPSIQPIVAVVSCR